LIKFSQILKFEMTPQYRNVSESESESETVSVSETDPGESIVPSVLRSRGFRGSVAATVSGGSTGITPVTG
jgi:hypothetical protein